MSTSLLAWQMNIAAKMGCLCLQECAVSLSELLVEGSARQCASSDTCVALHAHTEVSTEAVLHNLHSLDDA